MLKISQLIRSCAFNNISNMKFVSDVALTRNLSDTIKGINEDVKKRFYEPEIQKLLKQLTRADLNKVFRRRKLEKKMKAPKYKFMTTQEVEVEMEKATRRAEEKLQMPPVLPPRKEINEVLSVDKELIGLSSSNSNIIFTDITFGRTDRTRTIVVREPNGTLRKAKWDERCRMNQIYFPIEGRKLVPPKLFLPENLLNLCERTEYNFVLDFACLQFEPDDPEFHRITVTVFDHVNDSQNFELLRSTRHYGSLIFHIVSNRNIDDLIIENIKTDRLEDAVWAIELLHILKPESKSANTIYKPGSELEFIKSYVELDSTRRGVLEMTVNSYIETHENLPGLQKQAN